MREISRGSGETSPVYLDLPSISLLLFGHFLPPPFRRCVQASMFHLTFPSNSSAPWSTVWAFFVAFTRLAILRWNWLFLITRDALGLLLFFYLQNFWKHNLFFFFLQWRFNYILLIIIFYNNSKVQLIKILLFFLLKIFSYNNKCSHIYLSYYIFLFNISNFINIFNCI